MQPIVHFLMSIVAGLGVGLHIENKRIKYLIIVLLAMAATGIDLDHLLPTYTQNGVSIFHNVFVFIVFPSILFWIFYIMEHNKESSTGQRASLALCVMFVGHMFLDSMFGGTLKFLYPVRLENFAIINVGITLNSTYFTLTSEQVILIIWGAIIFGANIVETLIYNDCEGKKSTLFYVKDQGNYSKRDKQHPIGICTNALIFLKMQIAFRLKGSQNRAFKKNTQT